MKLSLSNGTFCKRSLDENIGLVKRLGFENLEFNMKCVEEEDEEAVYVAKKLIDSHGLTCLTLHAAALHVKSEEDIPKAVYYGRVSADFAYKLSAPVMVVHSNVSRKLPEKLRNKFLKLIFKELRPYARNLNVKLTLENLSYASSDYGKNVAELEEIFRIIDEEATIGFTLDFCHAEATGQTFNLLEKYHKWLCNVHMSNRAHKPFDSVTNSLNAVITKLLEHNYDGPITMELNSKCTTEEILNTKHVLEKILS